MKNLKTALIEFVMEKPVRFRAGLVLAGIMAGLLDNWFLNNKALEVSTTWLALLFGFSTLVYAFMLTLYIIIKKVFRLGRGLPEHVRHFDERLLVKAIGIFGLVPFGLSFYLATLLSTAEPNSLGSIFIVEGLSLGCAVWLSQALKKQDQCFPSHC